MRVTVTSDCAGTGQCVLVDPSTFELGDDFLSRVVRQPVGPDQEESARQAADLCPMAAIQIED